MSASTLSVVVPVYNAQATLAAALEALISASAPVRAQLIVVDDASTDDSGAIAEGFPVKLVRSRPNRGPAFARNLGARAATGEILVFVDADVVVSRDGLARIADTLAGETEIVALFGSYDAEPLAQNLISQYRNLLHHHTHQRGNHDASTFWSGYGAIRTTVFSAIGGFDDARFPYAMEDVALGYRLRNAGYRLRLDRSLQCRHLKAWTLGTLLKTDFHDRAIPWTELLREYPGTGHTLNIRWTQKLAVTLTMMLPVFGVLIALDARWSLALLFGVMLVIALNGSFFGFLLRSRGLVFAAHCVPLQLLHHFTSGLAYLWVFSRERWRALSRR